MRFEYLKKLSLLDDGFEYASINYEYNEIKHVVFSAAEHRERTFFGSTRTRYRANLFLHLGRGIRVHIRQERTLFGGNEKERFDAVLRAAYLLMDVTFEQRVEEYERQMESKGFVCWGDYQIGRNGDLFKNFELRFNILKDDITCELGPFHLNCRPRKRSFRDKLRTLLPGSSDVIDISIDKDCFLYVMKRYLGLSWKNHAAPERKKSNKSLFNEALLVLGGKLCKADGRISREEIARFKDYFGIDDTTHPGAGRIFMNATKSGGTVEASARRVYILLNGNSESLEYVLLGLIQIAAVDGHVASQERKFIRIVGAAFGYSDEEVDRLFFIFLHSQERGHERSSYGRAAHDPSQLRTQYLGVLGLGSGATIAEVRLAYRNLAQRHHPDRLRARGVPIDDIATSEEVLKTINVAYAWLKSHYARNEGAGS